MNIIKLALKAGWDDKEDHINIEAFAELVRADERRFIAEKWEKWYGYDKHGVAEFIRKRANTKEEQT
jgi:hypothetical protein